MYFLCTTREGMIRLLPTGGVGAEIGVFAGEFSKVLLDTVKPERLHLIDAWAMVEFDWNNPPASMPASQIQSYRDYLKNYVSEYDGGHPDKSLEVLHGRMQEFAKKNPQLTLNRGLSRDVVRSFPPEYFDFVYIDADHNYGAVLDDLLNCEPKVKQGGLIMGHDFYEDGRDRRAPYGVIDAVNVFLKRTGHIMVACTAETYSSFVIAKGDSPYARAFVSGILNSEIFTVEINNAQVANYQHKFYRKNDGSMKMVPSF